MLVKEISLNKISSQQITEYICEPETSAYTEYTVCEPETSAYIVDCYPYAIRGILWGLLLSIVFWGSMIGVLIRVF